MAASKVENLGAYIVVGAVAVLVVLVVLLMPNQHIWRETLNAHKEEPYDLSVFKTLLDSSSTKPMVVTKKSVADELDDYFGYNYFFLGGNAYFDSTEFHALFEFAERGNTVFIATPELPQLFYDECDSRFIWLGGSEWTESKNASSEVHYYENEYEFGFKGPTGSENKWWSYIKREFDDDDYEDEEDPEEALVEDFFPENFENDTTVDQEEVLAVDPDTIVETEEEIDYEEWVDFEQLGGFQSDNGKDTVFGNFFVADVGKGTVFLHCNPIMFSNYYMTKEDGFLYANEVLSFLDNRPVIWDNYHQIYHYEDGDYPRQTNTPLRFIFQHPSLKYAWLTLVGSALLFLIFRSKREQRVIPIIPPVENTSMAFARSLGVLYHQATSGRFLAIELMRMFDNFNRRQYRYNRNRKNPESAAEIAKKSRVKQELLDEIITLERQTIYNPTSKISQVFVLYNRLEEFYKQAKK